MAIAKTIADETLMNLSSKRVMVIVIVGILLVLIGSWFFYSRLLTVNYLIPGVPYNGIYNLFFQRADSDEISHILDVLGYWGDKRFALPDLKQKFPPARIASSTAPTTLKKSEIQNFFTENGYETSGWLSVEPNSVIKKLKQFVNSKKKYLLSFFPRKLLMKRITHSCLFPRWLSEFLTTRKKSLFTTPITAIIMKFPIRILKRCSSRPTPAFWRPGHPTKSKDKLRGRTITSLILKDWKQWIRRGLFWQRNISWLFGLRYWTL